MGRPPIEITSELCKNAEALASQGLTLKQIANVLRMGESTLHEKKADFLEFAEAIKRGQDKGVAVVVNAMFENAKGVTISEDKVIKLPGGGEKVVRIEKKLAPNVVAGIFYLKNRGGWKDKHDVEHSGNVTHQHEGISRTLEILGEFRGIRSAESIQGALPN